MAVFLGTSGYSYQDWKGPYYPADLPDRQMLSFYAREFSAVEINFTYYQMPSLRTMVALSKKTPPDFRFAVKAHGSVTHERTVGPDTFRRFVDALTPLLQDGKLGCILLQFPNSFKPSPDNRAYIRFLREQWPALPLVVEFRNARWLTDSTFALLKELDIGFCCVDEPLLPGLLPPIAVATSPIGYVRFHGRNASKWYEHRQAWERYDYTYTVEELREWVPRIQTLATAAREVLVFANNHWQGQAIDTIRKLRMLLAEAGVEVHRTQSNVEAQAQF